jgi:hypothetical protein
VVIWYVFIPFGIFVEKNLATLKHICPNCI